MRPPTPMLQLRQRLESIIKSLTSQHDAVGSGAQTADTEDSPSAMETGEFNEEPPCADPSTPETPIDQQLGRLMIDDTRSYYVSNILWANLGNEIEELRDMLHEPSSEDENARLSDLAESSIDSPLGSSAALLGFRSLAHSLESYHPPLPQAVALFRIFSENVVPMVHIFHMPTTRRVFWDAVVADSLDRNTEAVLFAIYYSAIISLDSEQCENIMGATRVAALEKYRFAVEQALARANFLNTQSMTLLQATVLFLSALRNEDDSRTTWSLTSLVFHIAQSMGLHRDGTAFGLKPLEVELRRRLWWHICLLDFRSSEFHGCEPIARESLFDTKPPLNINDSDINAHMKDPPPEHEGATEMTFCLLRCEALKAGWKVSYALLSMRVPEQQVDVQDREVVADNLKQQLEERFIRYCDTSVPLMLLSSTVARLIIARTWLVVHYPAKGQTLDSSKRSQLLKTSVEALELSSMILSNKDISRWTWHSKTHIQWQAVALVLSEICSRPPSPECDRAWESVSAVYNQWNMKDAGKRGNLWRPINRLMAKARYVREMQKIDPAGYRGHGLVANLPVSVPTSGSQSMAPSTSNSEPSLGEPLEMAAPMASVDSMFGMEPGDSFLDLSLEGLEAEMFDVTADGSWQWDDMMGLGPT
ncbi:hypothetical protein FDECE_16250 [Fusarium decemcellulare]|nr:hypothetical protein FDECE_16250 [Fusarium decemcellulare]